MYAVLWERICPYLPDRASRWQSYPLIYEPFFILRDIEFHLDISFSVCHAPPPFFIRVWDYPNKHFEFSGKGPENLKIRKRVLACCACYRILSLLIKRFGNLKMPAK